MVGRPNSLNIFRLHSRVGRIHQCRLSRCQMHDGVGNDGNKNQQDDPLPNVSENKIDHCCLYNQYEVIILTMDILQLSHYLDNLLDISSISDSPNALNGLQVQNTGEIKKIGLAVDLCQATIDLAIEKNCQMMFVHHGIFWGGLQPLRGTFYEKVSSMISANLGLYSAHIPLDLHPVLGNNRALADLIGLENLEPFGEYGGIKIGFKGTINKKSAEALAQELSEKLGSSVKLIGAGDIESVGLVTGGAAEIVGQASREGLSAYITGEGANHHYHEAIEGHCVLIFAGHYATETGGVKAVGKHLEEKFGVTSEFLDYPTGL